MYAVCAGKCHLCYMGDGGCLAGNGDNEFERATEEQLLVRLVKSKYKDYHDMIRQELRERNPVKYAEAERRLIKTPDEYAKQMLRFATWEES